MVSRVEKTTLYLPRDLQLRLRETARRRGRPQAELVRDALAAYLDEDAPGLTLVGVGDDRDLSAADSEDWLRREWGGG